MLAKHGCAGRLGFQTVSTDELEDVRGSRRLVCVEMQLS